MVAERSDRERSDHCSLSSNLEAMDGRDERPGCSGFERIESEDSTAVVGLPLLALTRALVDLGFPLP